ncbi:fasciclin domain-containing protein [Roseivivax sediminis]|uniref:Uncaracterized surface protein containing fasciclin (FAS1) repeats n=1 Tax=Roseivivax sediminis TaxID=936889 RepID=A0A1I1ZYL2_9RHOB|nr:fasciclin domain-containing protein [Roseivivax sediminis]SFE36761.1 Uncaracterized surface protein containing fasciclin (FAS1) repeats [Roseivivax sediminis]
MDRRRFLSLAAAGLGTPAAATTRLDLAATLGARAQFITFCDALIAAGLGGTLRSDGPYTVFAPKLAAFDALGRRRLDRLTRPAMRDTLRRLLAHHIVPGEYSAFALTGRRHALPTLAGTTLGIDGTGPGLRAANANVGRAEISASNGVIHTIDRVLRPPYGV